MSGLFSLSLGGELADTHRCSRAGCELSALWALKWRNPKIHSADRTKVWLACADHHDYLRDFLTNRSFPLTIVSITELEQDS